MAIYWEDIVDIDLERGNLNRSFMNRSIGLSDSKANRFGIRVFRNGETVSLSNVSVHGYFRDSHGNNISITQNEYQYKSGNVAAITLPQLCYNYEGQFTLAIKLVGGGVTGTMRIIDGMVNNTNISNPITQYDTVPTYQEVLAYVSQMEDMLEDAANFLNDSVAHTYDGTESYLVGDYVIYNGKLYRCKTDIIDPETDFEPDHWTACTAMGQLNGLREDIALPYNDTATYLAGDYVSYNRHFWISNVNNNEGHTPGASGSETYWDLFYIVDGFAIVEGEIAPEYSSSSTYSAGEYVTYNNKLWRSKIDGNNGTAPASGSSNPWAQCTAAGQVKSVIEGVASAYDPEEVYEKGDYVSYNREFYRCKVALAGDEPFAGSSKWDKVNIANDLKATVELISGTQYRLVI